MGNFAVLALIKINFLYPTLPCQHVVVDIRTMCHHVVSCVVYRSMYGYVFWMDMFLDLCQEHNQQQHLCSDAS